MATITKTPSNTWKAVIRKRGWPTMVNAFRTKRQTQDWACRPEDEMVRGAYIDPALSERTALNSAMKRFLAELSRLLRPADTTRQMRGDTSSTS